MKHIAFAVALSSFTAVSAFAEPAVDPRMSQQELRDDLIVSTQAQASSASAIWLPLIMLALVAAAASSVGGDHYYHGMDAVATSDKRLKTDIRRVGTSPAGIGIYQFRYVGDSTLFEGVLAQDVLARRPEAVLKGEDGFYKVDYARVDVMPKVILN